MWVALAISLPLAAFVACCAVVGAVRPRPLALVAPLALAVLICWEAIALQILSLASAVARPGVALAQIVPVIVIVVWRPRAAWRGLRSLPEVVSRSAARLGVPGLLVAPLFVVLALSAARYAPNNWDSMTYHLARVAHWIQQGSVAPYPTHIGRQVLLGPGAEYLLLVVQVISWSDALANFVQLSCWVLLVWSAPSLARVAGAPERIARWAAVLVAAMPMTVLQATSTQNDLVSAVMTVAVVVASTPFLHRSPRWRGRDVTLLAATGAAAVLVKPLAVVVVLPVLAIAAWRTAAGIVRARAVARALGTLAANAAVAMAIAGPTLLQISRDEARAMLGDFLFPPWGEWTSRGLNVLRGIPHHLPLPAGFLDLIGVDIRRACGGGALCSELAFSPHEDFAGNPAAAAVVVVLLAVAAWRWRSLRPLPRASAAAVVLAWIAFHLVVRENAWFSRLQAPVFALSVGVLPVLSRVRPSSVRLARLAVASATVLALGHGYAVAVGNPTRPPLSTPPWARVRDWSYYVNRASVRPRHDAALATAGELGCRKIGLLVGGDSYDYPLTWRAMQRGIEVRHVFGADPWPCVVFAEDGPGAAAAVREAGWLPTSVPSVFVNLTRLGR